MRTRSLLLPFALVAAACSDSSGPSSQGGNSMTATIDGAAWSSGALYSSAAGSANGSYSIVGTTGVANQPSVSLVLFYIDGPGTYPLGVASPVRGGIGTISQTGAGWSTPLSGSAGTVTVTSVNANRIAGTFSFTATPIFGSGDDRVVTGGTFNVPLTAPAGAVAPNSWSSFTGTLNSQPWTAAVVVTVEHPSSGILTLGVSNNDYLFNLLVSEFTGPGTYTLNTGVVRQMTAMRLGTLQNWGGASGMSTGTVTVSSYSTGRVVGSFSILMQPGNNTVGTLSLSGNFSVGLGQ